MAADIHHKGWDWTQVKETAWTEVSDEFLPTALRWARQYRSMIDIGAGKGRHALFMNGMGMDVLAVDLSPSGIDVIRMKNEQAGGSVKAVTADMTALPADDAAFDCAVCFHAVYHTDWQGLCRALAEIRRVLKPNGEVYLTFNAKDNPSFTRGVPVDGHTIYKTGGLEDGIPHTYVDIDDIRTLMDGFAIVNAQKIEGFVHHEKPTYGVHYYVLARKTQDAS